jgi:hypothetical protein
MIFQEPLSLLNAGSNRLRFIQAGHQNGELGGRFLHEYTYLLLQAFI